MSRELKGKARGSNHGSAKLTDEIVLEMRKLGREYGLTSTAVAKKIWSQQQSNLGSNDW